MSQQKWPEVGDVILVQDRPTTDAQRELWKNRQPPARKGEVVEVPGPDGSGYLTIDVGGEYGGVTYSAFEFGSRYTWKPAASEQADALLIDIRDRMRKIRTGWANPQYGTNITEETGYLLDAFERLDALITTRRQRPTSWK